ncbi:MAG: hypothetical protein ACREAE_07275 [Nitrosopumilaceae archaeon]
MKFVAILLGLFLVTVIGFHNSYAEMQISSWMKNTARQWSEQKIDDDKFVQLIQYLIKSKVIHVSSESSKQSYFLPKYGQISLIPISGKVEDFRKNTTVFLTILRPDGQTMELKAAVLETGVYQTTLLLNHDFPTGTYKVTGTYNDVVTPVLYFQLEKNIMTKIPFWVRNNAKWWADGKISDNDFVSGIQYLIGKKIIQIEYKSEMTNLQKIYVDVQGQSQVRRGIMQTITVTVIDGKDPISGATVTMRVEDYGENKIKEFDGKTDSNGKSVFSWEIDKNADAETLLIFVDATDGYSSASSVFSFEVTCHCGELDCECR